MLFRSEAPVTLEAAPHPGRKSRFETSPQADNISTEPGHPANADFGNVFPTAPEKGDIYLRTDYLPNALYRYNGKRWVMYEQGVRMTMNQFGNQDVAAGTHFEGSAIRQTQMGTFVNNANTSTIGGKVVTERQALSRALKPKADN